MNVIIIGAGGHGQVVADIFLATHRASPSIYRPIGYLDDNPAFQGRRFLGLPVLGTVSNLTNIPHDAVIVAIGRNAIRYTVMQQLAEQGETLVTAIHPTAIVGTQVEIGIGTVLSAGVIVNPGTNIGNGVILNTGCTVDHHNRIDNYAHIAPGVHIGGDVEIGEGTLVGIGATVMPQRQVGAWSVIGAGAVVCQNIPNNSTAVGIPARATYSKLR